MESVKVEIFGQVYNIKGEGNHDYISELASYVDAKMKDVQKGTGTADPHRVAILTALTISDELFRLRRQHGALEKTAEAAAQRLLAITEAKYMKAES
jgi:cell division protein ZapA (FtsZ GTPase activity inhibitor)